MATDDPIKTSAGGNWDVLPPLPTRPKRLRLPLSTALDVRRELARLYRGMKTGEIATADGTKLAYVLNILRQTIETSDMESRVQALEAKQNNEGDKR